MDGSNPAASESLSSRAPPEGAVFSLRIVSIDTYQSPPHPLIHNVDGGYVFARSKTKNVRLRSVPTIRIFGITRWGQKATLHVHQCWPYFYIPYDGSLDPSTVAHFITQLAISLNYALSISRSIDPSNPSRSQHLQSAILCQGVPFYGLHSSYRPFLKLSFIDPFACSRAADLLASGAIMGRPLQPHESHIPYLLQFLLDHNLFGMDFIHLRNVLFRTPINAPETPVNSSPSPHHISPSTVPPHLVWPQKTAPQPPNRISRTDLEMDCWCADILNRGLISERPHEATLRLANSSSAASATASHSNERAPYVPSLSTLWSDERVRRVRLGLSTNLQPPSEAPRVGANELKWDVEDELRGVMEEKCAAAESSGVHWAQDIGAKGPMPGLPTAWQAVELSWSPPRALENGLASNRVNFEAPVNEAVLHVASPIFASAPQIDIEPDVDEALLSQHLSQKAEEENTGTHYAQAITDAQLHEQPHQDDSDEDEESEAILEWMKEQQSGSISTFSTEPELNQFTKSMDSNSIGPLAPPALTVPRRRSLLKWKIPRAPPQISQGSRRLALSSQDYVQPSLAVNQPLSDGQDDILSISSEDDDPVPPSPPKSRLSQTRHWGVTESKFEEDELEAIESGEEELPPTPPRTFCRGPSHPDEKLSKRPSYIIIKTLAADPYYSNPIDVPSRVKIFGGKEWRLKSHTSDQLKEWNNLEELALYTRLKMKSRGLSKWWTPGHGPPPHREIESWVLCNPIGRKDVSFEAEDKTD
ncbi:hypothetical protein M427DRAFT_106570, partial [Gonapodya prolifera JEL478]